MTREELRDKVAIVLVEPQSPGNVGMVFRAMKNMGLMQLRLVNPCALDHPEAHKFAVSARDLLDRAKVYENLADALADCEITVGTTRRHGKYRQEIFSPQEMATIVLGQVTHNRAALVFGREDSGLTTEELTMCRWHATIPTSPDYGSLNLAQSVLIFCYELFKAGEAAPAVVERQLASTNTTEELYRQMESSLLRIGFLNPQNPAHLMRSLRRIFSRAELDDREVAILRGMVSQVDWATTAYEGKKGR